MYLVMYLIYNHFTSVRLRTTYLRARWRRARLGSGRFHVRYIVSALDSGGPEHLLDEKACLRGRPHRRRETKEDAAIGRARHPPRPDAVELLTQAHALGGEVRAHAPHQLVVPHDVCPGGKDRAEHTLSCPLRQYGFLPALAHACRGMRS